MNPDYVTEILYANDNKFRPQTEIPHTGTRPEGCTAFPLTSSLWALFSYAFKRITKKRRRLKSQGAGRIKV